MAAGSAEGGDLGWGTAATERGIAGANRGAACRLGQAAWGGDERAVTSESLGVKEQAFLEFSQAGSDASAGTSPSEGSAWAVSAARSVGSAAVGGWLWSSGWGLCPKDRFPRRGVGLGVGLGKQFSLPKCVRENECLTASSVRCRCAAASCAAGGCAAASPPNRVRRSAPDVCSRCCG